MQLNFWAMILGVAGFGAALVLLLSHQTNTLAEARRAALPPSTGVSDVETTKIMPADVLGTGVISWMPRTGDASN